MIATSQFTITVVNDGQQGAEGIYIQETKEQYFLSTSPSALTGNPSIVVVDGESIPVGQWTDVEPSKIPDGYYLFGRYEFTMSDGETVRHSDAVHRSTIEGIINEVDTINGQITSKVWSDDIDTAISAYDSSTTSTISNRISSVQQNVNGIMSQVLNITSSEVDGQTVYTSQRLSTIEQNAETFQSTVSSTYATKQSVDALDGRLTTAETTITQNADKIALMVTVNNQSSSLTLTDRMLQAITSQFVITDQSGTSTIITGGKIAANSITTAMLAADAIRSTNYEPSQYENSPYSESGTYLNLTTGNIITPNFGLDAVNSTAYIDGTISARNLFVGAAAAELSASAGTLNSSQGALVGYALDAASDYLIYDGESIYIKTSNFGIDSAGNVTMTGEVNAASGSIGGWEISDDNLHYGSPIGSSGSVYLIPQGSTTWHSVGGSNETDGWVITAGENFGVTKDGALYASDANITGTFTITDGGIGGMTIDSDSVYGTTAGMSSNQAKWAFWAGETNGKNGASGTNAVFKVGQNGKVYATNAEITGKITASDGTIGGWKIASDSLYYSQDTVPQVGTANSVFLCPEGSSTKKSIGGSPSTTTGWVFTAGTGFGVTRTGAVYASSGRIGGVTLSDCNIYAYNTTTTPSFQLLSTGSLAIGGTSGITVDTNGVLSIPAARITGKLTAGQIETGALTITQLAGFDIDDDMLRTAGIDPSSIDENSITLSTTDFSRTANNRTYAGLRFAIGSNFFVSKSGALYCTSGRIGGFSMGTTHLYALDSNYATYTYLQGIGTDGSVYLGATNLIPDGTSTSNYSAVAGYKTTTWRLTIGQYFGVTGSGKLYCNSCNITGGQIGVLNIDSDRLYTGDIGKDDSVFIRASNLGTSATVASYYTDKWRFTVGANFGVTGSTVYGKRIRIINTSATKWDFTSDTSDYTFTVQNAHATDSSKRITLKIGAAGEAGMMIKNNFSNMGGFIVTNNNEMGIINWTNASDPSWPFRYSFTDSSSYITGTNVYIKGSPYTSSDERIKTIHKTLNDDHKKLFMSLKPIEYSFVDRPEERHFGLGAQTTEASMKELGFGAEYGMVNHSLNDHKDQYGMDESYYLNYIEALMLSVPVVQDHEKEIAKLKTKIEELENKLSQLTQ